LARIGERRQQETRRVRKWLIGGSVVAVLLAGGAYYGLAIYPSQLFRAALDQTLRTLPAGQAGSYASAYYSLLTQRATMTGVAYHHADPDGFDATASEIDLTHPAADFAAAWARAAADPGALAQDLALPLGDEVAARDVTYRDATASAKLATLQVARPRVYPWALLHPGTPSMAEARARLLEDTHAPELSDILPLIQAEAVWVYGVGYDGYSAQTLDATATVPPTPNTTATTIAYSIRTMSSGAFDRGDAASMSLDGIAMRSDVFGGIMIGHIGLEDLRASTPLGRLVAGEAPSPAMLDGLTVKRIVYGPVTIQPPAGPPGAIENFSLANVAFSHGLLSSGDVAVDGFRVRRDQMPNPALAEILARLGTDTLTVSLDLGYRWDIDQQRMTIAGATLNIVELGKLTVALDLDRVASERDLMARARFVHGTARFDDASLTDRALKLVAAHNGSGDPASLRKQLIATFAQFAADPRTDAATKATADAIVAFLAAPRSLQLDLAPPEPVPLLALLGITNMSPTQSIALFGVTAAANK
jgi:hypothetical protein